MPTDVLDLYAKVKFDSSEFDSGMKDTEEKFSGFGDKVKNGLGALATAAAGAVAAGAAAVGKIVSDSVSAYSSYEQLVGGVQTLFGDSAQKVLENSEKAFQTAGKSMNEYMEISIQSAAALINSLDGDQAKAAELMDMSIIDMSDNVNKMGTTMEAVQNAYRGFSRGNFTMLDNLALGFAGTKEGMQELLDKAEQISGIKYDISSYSDIVQAIHVVQQEMGITGTTAAEAADTIQGSAGSMKAAWENLKVELVKEDGDVGKSIDILVDSALQAFDNIEPKIERALGGVTAFVGKAAPIIVEKLPPIIEQVIPPLISASSSLVIALGKGIAGALPSLLKSAGGLMSGLFGSFSQSNLGMFDWIREDAVKAVSGVAKAFKNINSGQLLSSFSGLGGSTNGLFEQLGDGVAWLSENVLSPVIEWGGNDILPSVFSGLASSIDILTASLNFLKTPALAVWEGFLQPLASVAGDVISGSLDLIAKGLDAIAKAVDGVDWEGYWIDMFDGHFGENWKEGWEELQRIVGESGAAIDEFFNVSEFGEDWNNFWQGVGEKIYDINEEYIGPICDNWIAGFKDLKFAWDDFKDAWETGVDAICEFADKLINKWNEFWDLWSAGIGEVKRLWDELKDDYLEGIDMIGDAIGWFVDPEGQFDRAASENMNDTVDEAKRKLSTPKYAGGGFISSGGRGIVAEAGPELLEVQNGGVKITPLTSNAKNTAVSGHSVVVNMNFPHDIKISNDLDMRRVITEATELISENLRNLNIFETRAIGGTGI